MQRWTPSQGTESRGWPLGTERSPSPSRERQPTPGSTDKPEAASRFDRALEEQRSSERLEGRRSPVEPTEANRAEEQPREDVQPEDWTNATAMATAPVPPAPPPRHSGSAVTEPEFSAQPAPSASAGSGPPQELLASLLPAEVPTAANSLAAAVPGAPTASLGTEQQPSGPTPVASSGTNPASSSPAALAALPSAPPPTEVEPAGPIAPPPPAAEPALEGTTSNVQIEALRLELDADGRQARLELEPAELGRVAVQLELRAKSVRAVLRVESKHALEALQNQMPELRQAFEARGLSVAGIELRFEQGNAQGGSRSHEQQQPPTPRRYSLRVAASRSPVTPLGSLPLPNSQLSRAGGVDTLA